MSTRHTERPSPGESGHRPRRRRRWLAAFGLFLAVLIGSGLIVAAVVWLSLPKYKATAYLHVASRQPALVFEPATDDTGRGFKIYKDTQAQYIKSERVLTAVLRDREVASLRIVQREKDEPIKWLQDNIQVSFPGEAEIMEVSLAGDDPEELTKLVNAVVDAYLREIVGAERHRRNKRLNDLDNIHVDINQKVWEKMNELRQLARGVGTADPEARKLRQEVALQRLSDIRREHLAIQTRLALMRAELEGQRTLLADVDTVPIPQRDVDDYVASHPVAAQLSAELAARMKSRANTQATASRVAASERAQKYGDEARMIEARMEELGREAEGKIREKMRSEIEAEIRRLELQIEALGERAKQLASDVKREEEAIVQSGAPSVDLQMRQGEVQQLKEMLGHIMEERERARIELGAEPRVTLWQRAEVSRWQPNW